MWAFIQCTPCAAGCSDSPLPCSPEFWQRRNCHPQVPYSYSYCSRACATPSPMVIWLRVDPKAFTVFELLKTQLWMTHFIFLQSHALPNSSWWKPWACMRVWGPTHIILNILKCIQISHKNLLFAVKESRKEFYNFAFEIMRLQVTHLINYWQWFLANHTYSGILSKWENIFYTLFSSVKVIF